jgi:predicted patatin/cPLA2 family phospholipase
MLESKFRYRILSLDGGGSKGVYTLGVLTELEAELGSPLSSHFDLVYGTSTGAIIAAMVALGLSVETIKSRYFKLIPRVMKHRRSEARSSELKICAMDIFGEKTFEAFVMDLGIVSTNANSEIPLIFKRSSQQAMGRSATFAPGFGCTIVDALLASTAAYPLFNKHSLNTAHHGPLTLLDGGYVANNPTLFAIADALQTGAIRDAIDVLSVGVGRYLEPRKAFYWRMLFKVPAIQLIQTQLATSTNTIEIMRKIFFKDVACVRVDEAYTDAKYATDLLESSIGKLETMFALGRASYGKQQNEVHRMLERN